MPRPSQATAATSRALARFETNRFYQPGLLDAPDPWLWEALVAGTSKTIGFSLSGVERASPLAVRLSVALQGASDVEDVVDHHVRVSVNGAFVGELRFDAKFPASLDVELPASLLREGPNELGLENTGEAGVPSLVFLDRFSLLYPQLPTARGRSFRGDVGRERDGRGLRLPSPPLGLLEIAGTDVRWLLGVEWAGGAVRFRATAGARSLVALAEAIPHPRVSFPTPSPWDATTQADYIVVAPAAFREAAERLVARRESQGLSALAVSLEAIAEHVRARAGLRGGDPGLPRPRVPPLRSSLASLRGAARRVDLRPEELLRALAALAAAAARGQDVVPLDRLRPHARAVNGDDGLPDLAIGRLPASSVEEAGILIDKLLAWEDHVGTLDGRAVLVADNPDAAGDFEANQRDIQSSVLAGRQSELVFLSALGSATRPAILEAFNQGASLMSYVGHGGAAVWASENVLNSWDTASLVPQSRQPVLITMNCLNGYFLAPGFNSIAEAFLKAEGRGSVAGFSPSGLSLDGPAHLYHRALVAELVSGRHARLGDALAAAQKAYAETGAMPELLSIYHLLGDPATTIR